MTDRAVTAVILAGGRSSRFGADKLAETINGRTLLQHAIDGVAGVAEIIVVAAPGVTRAVPDGVRLVHDETAFEGPLAGLLAGLRSAHGSLVLVVGGDMPSLVRAVVEAMLIEMEDPTVDAVVLEHDGRARPLPLVLRRMPAVAAAARLVDQGERRLRRLPEALATRVIPESAWRLLDPDGRTLHDVDTRADLPASDAR